MSDLQHDVNSVSTLTSPIQRSMGKRSRFRQNAIALVYDFDGTLTPQPMQETTIFPELGIDASEFWKQVKKETAETKGDEVLTYMRLLADRIREHKTGLRREDLVRLASKLVYYDGVEEWFDRINQYVRDRTRGKVNVKHYLVSSGLVELMEGASIAKHITQTYGCEYVFDQYDRPIAPKVAVNDTNKTQFLFRINKGRELLHESINNHMPDSERPIPFSRILYLGDGDTDVPCMTLSKKSGGHAIAVHKPRDRNKIDTCKGLFRAQRIDYVAPADYREGADLDRRVKVILDLMIATIRHDREVFSFERSLERRDRSLGVTHAPAVVHEN